VLNKDIQKASMVWKDPIMGYYNASCNKKLTVVAAVDDLAPQRCSESDF